MKSRGNMNNRFALVYVTKGGSAATFANVNSYDDARKEIKRHFGRHSLSDSDLLVYLVVSRHDEAVVQGSAKVPVMPPRPELLFTF